MSDELLNELGLEDEPRLQGALRTPFLAEYVRDLEESDIVALNTQPRGVVAKSLMRIHASHHALAKCIASGMKDAQAALVTGYSVPRIAQLKADPAFKALCADYVAEAGSVFADMTERMKNISLDALEILQERMQEKPEEFSVPMLLDVVKGFADRTGHGPNQEVRLTLQDAGMIDRPPRETRDEWEKRQAQRYLTDEGTGVDSTAGATTGGHNGRLVS